MALILFLSLILILFLRKNPQLNKIFIIALCGHLVLLTLIYAYSFIYIPRGNAFDDGDVFSLHAGIISVVLRDIPFDRAYLYEKISTEGNYFDSFFGKGLIPPVDSYAIGFITYLYSIIYASYGYAPLVIHIINILLNLLTGVVIFKLSKLLFNKQAALISLILFLFNPVSFYYATTKLKEPLYFLCAYLVIYLSVLTVKQKNFFYTILLIPFLILIRLVKWAYFYPIVLTLAIYFILVYLSKKRLIIFTMLMLIALMFYLKPSIIPKGLNLIFGMAEGMHKGHLSAVGHKYDLLIFGPEITLYNGFEQLIFTLNAWYHLIFEPLLSSVMSARLLLFYPLKIAWVILCFLASLGFISAFRYKADCRKEYLLLLLFFVLVGSVLAISSGNIGTMLRHRGIIEPVVFIFATYFICFKLKPAVSNIKSFANGSVKHEACL